MLAEPVVVDPSAFVCSGAAWFMDRLWTAGSDPSGALFLRCTDAQGDGDSGTVATPYTFGTPSDGSETASLLASRNRLWIVFGRIGEAWSSASMDQSKGFSTATPLPIDVGAVGPMALGSFNNGFCLLWTEVFGAAAHLLTSTDGLTWDDQLLPLRMNRNPALLGGDDVERPTVAFAGGTPGRVTVCTINTANGQMADYYGGPAGTSEITGGVALARTTYHSVERLHVGALRHAAPDYHAFGATFAGPCLGGEEPGPSEVRYLSFTTVGQLVYAVIGYNDNRLVVGPYMQLFGMSPEIAALRGQTCDPAECPPDPRIACVPTDVFETDWSTPRIANAYRGDLILTPADGEGIIGAILGALEPAQTFDHMGIMLTDYSTIRHCTMAHGRVQKGKRFMRGVLAGLEAPSDGFESSGIRYGWPGTITQSIEDAFYRGWNTRYPDGSAMNPEWDTVLVRRKEGSSIQHLAIPKPDASAKEKAAYEEQQKFCDPQYSTDIYSITNFPNVPQYHQQSGELRSGIVLKPVPAFEAGRPEIRHLLGRVADKARDIRGHYRFFAYSRADIAFDPDFRGPAAHWSEGTWALVCSTFIWAAIDELRRDPGMFFLLEGAAESAYERPAPSQDGLYEYDAAERGKAAQSLHDALVKKTQQEVYDKLIAANDEVSGITDVLRLGLTQLVFLLSGPLGAAPTFLGITPTKAADLAILLTDMPEQVANQLCNTFAFDKADDIDGHDWKTPGTGVSVSPDDIALFWDAPLGTVGSRNFKGLYGHDEPLLLVPRRVERRRKYQLDASPGPATVMGRVLYREKPVSGAVVRTGCEKTMTKADVADKDPYYRFDLLPAGPANISAEVFWPGSGFLLKGETVANLHLGEQSSPIDIQLHDPPDWRRRVQVWGDVYLIRKVLIGHDDIVRKPIVYQCDLAWVPDEWSWTPDDPDPNRHWQAKGRSPYAQRLSIGYKIEAELREDLSVLVKIIASLSKDDHSDPLEVPADDNLGSKTSEFVIAPGATHTLTITIEHNTVPPDRGRLTLNLSNMTAPT